MLMYGFLCERDFQFLLGKYIGVGLLERDKYIFLTIKQLATIEKKVSMNIQVQIFVRT